MTPEHQRSINKSKKYSCVFSQYKNYFRQTKFKYQEWLITKKINFKDIISNSIFQYLFVNKYIENTILWQKSF